MHPNRRVIPLLTTVGGARSFTSCFTLYSSAWIEQGSPFGEQVTEKDGERFTCEYAIG
jgi:hypothetical protein